MLYVHDSNTNCFKYVTNNRRKKKKERNFKNSIPSLVCIATIIAVLVNLLYVLFTLKSFFIKKILKLVDEKAGNSTNTTFNIPIHRLSVLYSFNINKKKL